MIVAVDANVLVYLLDEHAPAPLAGNTGLPVERCRERIAHLLDVIARARGRLIIPTPALAEVLVRGGSAAPGWLQILNGKRQVRIADFDQRAAIEFASLRAAQIAASTRHPGPRWKARIDEQIAAIAIVEGATTIYSDDVHMARLAQGGLQ